MSIQDNPRSLFERLMPEQMGLGDALKALNEAEQALDDCNLPLVRHHIEEAQYRVVTAHTNLEILSEDNGEIETYDGPAVISREGHRQRIAEFTTAECATTYRNRVTRRARESLDRDRAGP